METGSEVFLCFFNKNIFTYSSTMSIFYHSKLLLMIKGVNHMLKLQTGIEGKKGYFGDVHKVFKDNGFTFYSNFEYDHGKFDTVLCREGGETIYIRIPFDVLQGKLDRRSAYIQFGQPYVIKHVGNLGLDWGESPLLTTTGFNQFQEPLDKAGKIMDKSRWEEAGEQQVQRIVSSMNDLQIS